MSRLGRFAPVRGRLNNRRGEEEKDLTRPLNVTLMMLILAFFIVLNTLAVPAESKKKIALGSLTGTLGILPGGMSPFQTEERNVGANAAPMLGERLQAAYLLGKFEEYLVKSKTHQFAQTFISSGGIELTLANRAIFAEGSARLSQRGEELIDRLAPLFRQARGTLLVEGHANDPRVATARFPDAVSLTAARAGAVARRIVASAPVDREKVAVAGYGALRPLTAVVTYDDLLKNDRTSIRYRWAL